MFFTGTVSPERYEYICKKYGFKNDGSQDNEIITKIHRLFLERIRKQTGKSVKHWCVTEKGHTNTRRIHLHGLFYAREGQTKWQLTKLLYEKYRDWETDRKSTRLNSSHITRSRMPSSA